MRRGAGNAVGKRSETTACPPGRVPGGWRGAGCELATERRACWGWRWRGAGLKERGAEFEEVCDGHSGRVEGAVFGVQEPEGVKAMFPGSRRIGIVLGAVLNVVLHAAQDGVFGFEAAFQLASVRVWDEVDEGRVWDGGF